MIFRPTIVFVALLAGCSLAPEYQRPSVVLPQNWPEPLTDARHQSTQMHPTELSWRVFFVDPQLQVLIETALENNPDMRIAAARVEEARAMYGYSRADLFPSINASASATATTVPGSFTSTKNGYDSLRFDTMFSLVSYEFDFWGRVASMNDTALATFMASEQAKRSARLALISDVAIAYFSQLEMDERYVLTSATFEVWEQVREMTVVAVEQGAASNPDLLQVESSLELARGEKASTRRFQTAARNALNVMLGRIPQKLPQGIALRQQRISADFMVGVPSDVLLARPDVLAAEQRLKAANANIGAVRAAFFPRIALAAGLGLASPALAGLFSSTSSTWNFQPTISMPLFDGGRSAANVDIAQARKEIAIADYEKTVQQAFRETADLLSAVNAFAIQRRASEAAVRAVEQRLEGVKARYRAGSASFMNVLEMTREFHGAQQMLLQNQRAQLTTLVQLFKALGGGEPISKG
jgi:multidrug efflux system outer membrane protein